MVIMMREKVSVVFITLNEERNLPHSLEAVKWADEIVVIDSGSTDKTVQIAEFAGAKVFVIPWPGYARQWRNAIERCSHPWILLLCADEVVEEILAREIQEVLCSPGINKGFTLGFKHFFLGKWMQHCGWYPDYKLRMFRRDAVHVVEREVHESFTVNSPHIQPLKKGFILHYSYHSIRQYIEKFNRYTDLEAAEMVKNNLTPAGGRLLPAAMRKFIEMFLHLEGYKDGVHGLILCVLSALYEFVSISKTLELRGELKIR